MFYCLRCDNIDWSEIWAEIKKKKKPIFVLCRLSESTYKMEINGDTRVRVPFTLYLSHLGPRLRIDARHASERVRYV